MPYRKRTSTSGPRCRQKTYLERWEEEILFCKSLKTRMLSTIVSGGCPRVYLEQRLTDFSKSPRPGKSRKCRHCGAPRPRDDFSDLLTIGVGLVRLAVNTFDEKDFEKFEEKLLKVKIEDFLIEEGYEKKEATQLVGRMMKLLGDYWDKHDMQAWEGALRCLEAEDDPSCDV